MLHLAILRKRMLELLNFPPENETSVLANAIQRFENFVPQQPILSLQIEIRDGYICCFQTDLILVGVLAVFLTKKKTI